MYMRLVCCIYVDDIHIGRIFVSIICIITLLDLFSVCNYASNALHSTLLLWLWQPRIARWANKCFRVCSLFELLLVEILSIQIKQNESSNLTFSSNQNQKQTTTQSICQFQREEEEKERERAEREKAPNLDRPALVCNSQSAEWLDTFAMADTQSELEEQRQSIWHRFWNIWLLNCWNWQATRPKTTRSNALCRATSCSQWRTTMSCRTCWDRSRLQTQACCQTSTTLCCQRRRERNQRSKSLFDCAFHSSIFYFLPGVCQHHHRQNS